MPDAVCPWCAAPLPPAGVGGCPDCGRAFPERATAIRGARPSVHSPEPDAIRLAAAAIPARGLPRGRRLTPGGGGRPARAGSLAGKLALGLVGAAGLGGLTWLGSRLVAASGFPDPLVAAFGFLVLLGAVVLVNLLLE